MTRRNIVGMLLSRFNYNRVTVTIVHISVREWLRFINTPGLEPTNNLAEQAIRFVVLDRHVTQGTRSVRGQQWCERIWSTIATCSQQQRSVFEFLHQTVSNHFSGRPTPSLLPSGP